MAKSFFGGVGEMGRTVLIAFLIAIGVRTFAFEPFNIPSGSMIPTLLVGDYLFVSKFSYGYNRTDYIKRIMGLPGDRIQVVNGIVNINGEPVKRRQIEDYEEEDRFGRRIPLRQYIETLPNGVEHKILEISDNQSNDNTAVYTVPEGHFFAMGDNRDNSVDSRFARVGPIPRENLVGRADLIFYSTDAAHAAAYEFWNWIPATRFGRLMSGIR